MTSTETQEASSRKPTAKEIAEEAQQGLAQLRAELTEIRDALREGGAVTVQQGDTVTPEQLADLENRTAGGFERLQQTVDWLKNNSGSSATTAVQALEQKTADSFRAQAKVIGDWGTTITTIRAQLDSVLEMLSTTKNHGTIDHALADQDQLLDEIRAQVANKADANTTTQAMEALASSIGGHLQKVMTRVDKMAEYLESPTFAGIERTSDQVMLTSVNAHVPAIYGQVWKVMNTVTGIAKDGQADKKMGGYKFRSIEAATSAVGHALREVGVMFSPRQIVEKKIERYTTTSKEGYTQYWTHMWVTQQYAFVSLIDGSEVLFEMDGEARDNGDKSTSKADSMRMKYALLQALCIPTEGLPESDGSDGTEGGQVYGGGTSQDTWENATPAPRLPQQATTAPPAEPVDDRTPEEKATAAYAALVDLAGLEKPAQRRKLDAILAAIVRQGLSDIPIMTGDGTNTTLGAYATRVNSLVGA